MAIASKTVVLLLVGLYSSVVFAQTSATEESGVVTGVEPTPHPEEGPEEGPEKGPEEGSETAPESEPEAGEQSEDFEERLDALLDEASAADAYGDPINCLYRRRYRDIDIVSEDILLFSHGRNYWVNSLKRSCTGLRRNMVIHTVLRGISSLCENDMVYANRSSDLQQGILPSGRPSVIRANCILGEFKAIDEAYAESLKAMSRG